MEVQSAALCKVCLRQGRGQSPPQHIGPLVTGTVIAPWVLAALSEEMLMEAMERPVRGTMQQVMSVALAKPSQERAIVRS